MEVYTLMKMASLYDAVRPITTKLYDKAKSAITGTESNTFGSGKKKTKKEQSDDDFLKEQAKKVEEQTKKGIKPKEEPKKKSVTEIKKIGEKQKKESIVVDNPIVKMLGEHLAVIERQKEYMNHAYSIDNPAYDNIVDKLSGIDPRKLVDEANAIASFAKYLMELYIRGVEYFDDKGGNEVKTKFTKLVDSFPNLSNFLSERKTVLQDMPFSDLAKLLFNDYYIKKLSPQIDDAMHTIKGEYLKTQHKPMPQDKKNNDLPVIPKDLKDILDDQYKLHRVDNERNKQTYYDLIHDDKEMTQKLQSQRRAMDGMTAGLRASIDDIKKRPKEQLPYFKQTLDRAKKADELLKWLELYGVPFSVNNKFWSAGFYSELPYEYHEMVSRANIKPSDGKSIIAFISHVMENETVILEQMAQQADEEVAKLTQKKTEQKTKEKELKSKPLTEKELMQIDKEIKQKQDTKQLLTDKQKEKQLKREQLDKYALEKKIQEKEETEIESLKRGRIFELFKKKMADKRVSHYRGHIPLNMTYDEYKAQHEGKKTKSKTGKPAYMTKQQFDKAQEVIKQVYDEAKQEIEHKRQTAKKHKELYEKELSHSKQDDEERKIQSEAKQRTIFSLDTKTRKELEKLKDTDPYEYYNMIDYSLVHSPQFLKTYQKLLPDEHPLKNVQLDELEQRFELKKHLGTFLPEVGAYQTDYVRQLEEQRRERVPEIQFLAEKLGQLNIEEQNEQIGEGMSKQKKAKLTKQRILLLIKELLNVI